ncbi:MAG: hypothetical protein DMF82_20920 [Acidobacteria bacterium]|nr:MAG: hypothetical protein DMF82_20920 [Acidobacteriota bacterium]
MQFGERHVGDGLVALDRDRPHRGRHRDFALDDVRAGVDDDDRLARHAAQIHAPASGGRIGVVRLAGHVEAFDHLHRARIDDVQASLAAERHVDVSAVRAHADLVGPLAQGDGPDDPLRLGIDRQ